jgi:hypothetical protein
MKKIPTVFERDWNGDRSRVTPQIHAGCEWVTAGEGRATVKVDGTCCLVRDNKLYKRRELRKGDASPANFEAVDHDEETGKTVGWVPVGDGPEDKWHREAFARLVPPLEDGTYELVGPKVQGNVENHPHHDLLWHGSMSIEDAPRDYEGLRDWMQGLDIEGIVWHWKQSDGSVKMAKLKLRDFGIKRQRA